MSHDERKRAVIYVRVSSKEQAEEGHSLESQERRCRDYAERNGYVVVMVFIEPGDSAKTADRIELQKLLQFCTNKSNTIAAVIVDKIDRFARNRDDYGALRAVLRSRNVLLSSASEHFDDSSAGRFVESMLATIAQFDNDVRADRCKVGMHDAVKAGRYVWKAPFGYRNAIDANGDANIEPHPDRAPAVRRVFELVAAGAHTVDDVRRLAYASGLRWDTGSQVARGYFYRMIRNKLYMGVIAMFGEEHKGAFEPLISEELFLQAQRALSKRRRAAPPHKRDHEDFPLRRFITSGSGERLTGSWSRNKRGVRYAYYRFPRQGGNHSQVKLHEAFIAEMNKWNLSLKCVEKLKRDAATRLGTSLKSRQSELRRVDDRLRALEVLEGKIVEKNVNGVLTDAIAQRQLKKLEDERDAMLDARFSLSQQVDDVEGLLSTVQDCLSEPGTFWNHSNAATRLRLQQFQFPSGVTFDGQTFRTPNVAPIFAAKTLLSADKSSPVDYPVGFWNTVAADCKKIAEIIAEKDTTKGSHEPLQRPHVPTSQ